MAVRASTDDRQVERLALCGGYNVDMCVIM